MGSTSASVAVSAGRPATDDRSGSARTACRRGRAAARGRRSSPATAGRRRDRSLRLSLGHGFRVAGPRRRRQLGCVVGADDRDADALPGDDVPRRPSAARGSIRDELVVGRRPAAMRHGTGASVSFRFTGRAFASSRRRARAAAGAASTSTASYVSTVDLHRSSWTPRSSWRHGRGRRQGTHTVKLVVAGTRGHSRVDVDAFAVLR